MKEFFARLSSMERRFVIGVLIVIFLVINVLFVWPRFKDWGEMISRMESGEKKLSDRKKVIGQSEILASKIKEFEKEGAIVPLEDQVNEFRNAINNQAAQSGVAIIASTAVRQMGATNQFFTEQAQAVKVVADEAQLVDFLYRLGAGNSLIRVRDLSQAPDSPSRYKLSADLKLVASFQKKIAVRTTTAPTNAPAAKPAPPAPKTTTPPVPKTGPPPVAKPNVPGRPQMPPSTPTKK